MNSISIQRMPNGPEKSNPLLDKQLSILMKEWELSEVGIARYDTILNQIRTWAVTIFGALLAFSGGRWYIVAFAVVPTLLLLFIDAMNKGLQRHFIRRSSAIQRYLATERFISDCRNGFITYKAPRLSHSFWLTRDSQWLGYTFVAMRTAAVYPLYLGIMALCALLSFVLWYTNAGNTTVK
jgi:hypothetical protein